MTNFDKILAAAKAKRIPSNQAIDVELTESLMLIDEIQNRIGGNTRPLNQAHVEDLAESIRVLGLIEPLVVDSQGRLLAGGHRRAAIALLQSTDPETYSKRFSNGVPVHRLNFDAEINPELAIQIEVAENEQRRDYTPAEVRAIADRFIDAGYGVKGRPAKGQQPLIPALMAVVGKSRATVQRYLADDSKKSTSDETLSIQRLKTAHKALIQWNDLTGKTKAEKELASKLPEILELIESVFENK